MQVDLSQAFDAGLEAQRRTTAELLESVMETAKLERFPQISANARSAEL